MKHSKLYSALVISLGLTLSGCGDDSSSSSSTTTTTITTTPTTITDGSVSLSFPLTFGEYSSDTIDMFGKVSSGTLASFTLVVDGVEYPTTISGSTWRASNVSLTDSTVIEMKATKTNSVTSEKTLTLSKDVISDENINNNISDIAVDDSSGEIYVQVDDGASASETKFLKFDLDSSDSEALAITRDTTYLTKVPTSIGLAAGSDTLYVSYFEGITQIDLTTNIETILADTNNGTATTSVFDSGAIFDLFYSSSVDDLYVSDLNLNEIARINVSTGVRTAFLTGTTNVVATTVDVTNDVVYFSIGNDASSTGSIYSWNGTTNTEVYTATNGAISDIAVNEADNDFFVVDGNGDLIKVDVDNNYSTTTLLSGLFNVTTINGETVGLIGLHYDS